MSGLMKCRSALMPIVKPPLMVHLKLLICPSLIQNSSEAHEHTCDRKEKGTRKDRSLTGGRFILDMGKTEVVTTSQQGQWWRNCGEEKSVEVIVRELFSLQSPEIRKIPPGHFVQQAGPCEVFVSGRACGMKRMPVLPSGWVTVDAVAVGGPKYLEAVENPRWKVMFRSGSSKGDIVVREGRSLESTETAVLECGAIVEQSGPHEILEDGIVRMPITFSKFGANCADHISPGTDVGTGWVTCDASAQGGPKFFEPFEDDHEHAPSLKAAPAEVSRMTGKFVEGNCANSGLASWNKERTWKVVNLTHNDQRLAVTARAEPCKPGSGRVLAEDNLIGWLSDGDIIEQAGHSKKVRGFMVMPVRVVHSSGLDNDTIGWVTRRAVDKTKDGLEETWMVELSNGQETERGDRRKHRRRQV